jgi:excinuclease UvrABC ATPase subunit
MDNFNKLAEKFEYWCDQPLEVIAKAVKEKKKSKNLKPSAKSRHRGTVAVDVNHPKNKSNVQHFPVNSEAQGANAIARVHQYSSAPEWWSGSLKELQNTVVRKVHSEYPGIKIKDLEKKKKKSSLEILLEKYADNEDAFVKCPVCKDNRLASSPAHAKVHARQCAKKHNVDASKYKSFIEEAEAKSKLK